MKNFAGQPPQGGMMEILTGRELTTEVKEAEFQKRPLFVDNCKNCNMKNANGYDEYDEVASEESEDKDTGGSWFTDAFDVLKYGTGIWAGERQRQSAEEQAQAALQIEQARLAAERARASAATAQSQSIANKIKAYGLPIAITGVVVIGGIAAYFYFKKKKVS
jgi:hypothetical protein